MCIPARIVRCCLRISHSQYKYALQPPQNTNTTEPTLMSTTMMIMMIKSLLALLLLFPWPGGLSRTYVRCRLGVASSSSSEWLSLCYATTVMILFSGGARHRRRARCWRSIGGYSTVLVHDNQMGPENNNIPLRCLPTDDDADCRRGGGKRGSI